VGVVSQSPFKQNFFDALATVELSVRVARGERDEAWRREMPVGDGMAVLSSGSLDFAETGGDVGVDVGDSSVVDESDGLGVDKLDIDRDEELDADPGETGRRRRDNCAENEGDRAGAGGGVLTSNGEDNGEDEGSSRTTMSVR